MKIDAKFKPWLSVSDDSARLAVCGAYLDKEAGLLVATDGKMLSRYRVEDTADDEAGIIPVEALKAAAQLGKKSGNAVMTVKGGMVTLLDGRSWPTVKMSFPNWQQVLPNFTMPRTRTARLYLNPELLADLFKALAGGRGGAVIEFGIDADDDARQGPMSVTLPNTDALPGVLMPMRLGDRYPDREDDIEEAHEQALETATGGR